MMVTAVDTNVLLDVFTNAPRFGLASAECLRRCLREGSVVACDVVWAETAAAFPERRAMESAMTRLGIGFSALGQEAALQAGECWAAYRESGGPRERVLADFLVAAHAIQQAERLLTRDRGFYRQCFARLVVLDPSASPQC
jgi:predicted nucleic acid-binding protein